MGCERDAIRTAVATMLSMSDTEPDDRYLGAGERLSSGPSADLAHTAFDYELGSARILWRHLGQADRAHIAALVQANVVNTVQATALFDALNDLDSYDISTAGLDPFLGDVHNNRDVLLAESLGDIAGVLNTARARREATTIAWQIACRERLADLGRATETLANTLVSVAIAHSETFMPDFTYLQHAHPTTLAHYLLGFAYPVVRVLEHLGATLALVNRSPAGSGSVNGSPIPIDRDLLADLLEFDGVVTHTRDAMWAPDMALQQMFDIVSLAVTIDRISEELQIWATEEFGFVELADEHCRTSVIMPQKKNPYSLAYLRGTSREVIGTAAGLTATMMTPTGQPDNRIFSYIEVPVALERFAKNTRLLAAVLDRATFDRTRLLAASGSGYTYATDLCDMLVTEHGIDNRTAHKIVGSAVRTAISAHAEDITRDDIVSAGAAHGVSLDIDHESVERAQDLEHIVASRDGIGGAARPRVDEMVAELEARIETASSVFGRIDGTQFDERLRARVKSQRASGERT